MKKILYAVAISVLFVGCGSVSNPETAINRLAASNDMTQAETDSIASVLAKFPNNTQLAIGFMNDSTARYYGAIRKEDTLQTIDNANRVFEIGSISKIFTSALLAEMADSGELQLNDPVQQYLDFAIKDSLQITFKQLANHTSGMPRVPSGFIWEALWHMDNPYKDYDQQKLRKYLSTYVTLNNEPGSEYQYSNIGAGTLGYILTTVSGLGYGQMLEEQIFSRFDMHSSTVNRAEVNDRLVVGLDKGGDQTANWDLAALQGAGAILSSVADLSKFGIANFDSTNHALSLQHEPTYSISERRDVALGWFIEQQDNGSRWHLHNGGTGGYRSSIILDIADQKGVVILSNISAGHEFADDIDTLAKQLLRSLQS